MEEETHETSSSEMDADEHGNPSSNERSAKRRRGNSNTESNPSNATSNQSVLINNSEQPTIRFSANTTTASSTTAAATASTSSTTISGMLQSAVKAAIENYICEIVRRYGLARLELFNRQVALSSLQNHLAKNTLPKDLCFKIETGNPYKKSVPNRDALLEQERSIIHEAKMKILAQRIASATEEVQRYTEKCESFQNIEEFKQSFLAEFPEPRVLGIVNHDDCVQLYSFHLSMKRNNMDAYCKKREERYLNKIQRKQKTTPLTECVNEQQFNDSLQKTIYENIMKFANKYAQKPVANKTGNNNTKPVKKKTASKPIVSKQQQNQPQQQHGQQQQHKKQRPQRQQQQQSQQQPQNQSKKTYANVVNNSSSAHRKTNTNAANNANVTNSTSSNQSSRNQNKQYRKVIELDEDGFELVQPKRHQRNGKNDSAKDPRDVPKIQRRPHRSPN